MLDETIDSAQFLTGINVVLLMKATDLLKVRVSRELKVLFKNSSRFLVNFMNDRLLVHHTDRRSPAKTTRDEKVFVCDCVVRPIKLSLA